MDLLTLAMAKSYTNNQQLAYEEEKIILHELDLIQIEESKISTASKQGRLGLKVGETYRVDLDGNIHEVVCKSVIVDGIELLYLGNIGIFKEDYPLTKESFLIMDDCFINNEGQEFWAFYLYDFNASAKCTIYSGGEIHKIDPKFLPEGGFGWTEIEEGSLTFDGNIEGKEIASFIGPNKLIKISDEAIDISGIKEIDTMIVFQEQLTPGLTLTANYFVPVELMPGTNGLIVEDMPFVLSTKQEVIDEISGIIISAGTWIIYQLEDADDAGMYISAIHFDKKEIHMIDPKYLPDELVLEFDEETFYDFMLNGSKETFDTINDAFKSGKNVKVIAKQEDFDSIFRMYTGSADNEYFFSTMIDSTFVTVTVYSDGNFYIQAIEIPGDYGDIDGSVDLERYEEDMENINQNITDIAENIMDINQEIDRIQPIINDVETYATEDWEFTLDDGSIVTKTILVSYAGPEGG